MLAGALATGCSLPVASEALRPTPRATAVVTGILATASATALPRTTSTSLPTAIPTASATPPVLTTFTTSRLLRGVQPASYLASTCDYLQARWDPARSVPGTLIVPVAFHGVSTAGNRGPGDTTTPAEDLQASVYWANKLGFTTVTMTQAADFLESNASIPRLSMVWIVDDRNVGTVEDHMMPVMKANDWTMSMAWPIGDTDQRQGLWQRAEALAATGRVEFQAHGYEHNLTIRPTSSDQYVHNEIFGPLPILEKHFGRKPVAFVWPGGNFTTQAAHHVREAGYRLGFTFSARGPLMFNWIPLSEKEREVGDPLMVLPREWGYPGLVVQLRKSAEISQAAHEFALANYDTEAAYYRSACGGELPQPSP
jgi:peptidoglycan/xylan/chitin deacetylase (PgdA/CDA1 family)